LPVPGDAENGRHIPLLIHIDIVIMPSYRDADDISLARTVGVKSLEFGVKRLEFGGRRWLQAMS
jgi:hypothetical protein